MPAVHEVTCFFHPMPHSSLVEPSKQLKWMVLESYYHMGRVPFGYFYRSLRLTFPNQQLALVVDSACAIQDEFNPRIAIRRSSTSTSETYPRRSSVYLLSCPFENAASNIR